MGNYFCILVPVMGETLLKYKSHVTVSFPPYMMDLITEHCYLTGLSKQDLIRISVRSLLSAKFDQDIEKVAIERMKQQAKQKI